MTNEVNRKVLEEVRLRFMFFGVECHFLYDFVGDHIKYEGKSEIEVEKIKNIEDADFTSKEKDENLVVDYEYHRLSKRTNIYLMLFEMHVACH